MTRKLSSEEQVHYGRQIILPGWGTEGQERLAASRVLVVGAGGLGCPALSYLAAAGVGTMGIADGDFVEVSNLHRQVLHDTDSIDAAKATSAARRLRKSNPHVQVIEHFTMVGEGNVDDMVSEYDLVVDCSDNFRTRSVVHDTCYAKRKPLVSGAAQMFDGTVTTFAAFREGDHPCFHCLYPMTPSPDMTPSCSEIGVVGPALAVIGGMQAMEAIKEIIGLGNGLSGTVLVFDALSATVERIRLSRRRDCAFCDDPPGLPA